MNVMPLPFHIRLDCGEDGVWIGECPAIPGCVGQGETKNAAIASR